MELGLGHHIAEEPAGYMPDRLQSEGITEVQHGGNLLGMDQSIDNRFYSAGQTIGATEGPCGSIGHKYHFLVAGGSHQYLFVFP